MKIFKKYDEFAWAPRICDRYFRFEPYKSGVSPIRIYPYYMVTTKCRKCIRKEGDQNGIFY